MITINKSTYRAIQKKIPFEKRPYSFIFIKRSDYDFLDDFVVTFKNIGLKPHVVTINPTTNKKKFIQNMATAITSINPDFVFTFSHNGVDYDGDLIHFLEDLKIPLVSWMLDNPELIVRPYSKIISDNVFIFSSDYFSVKKIQNLGHKNVSYLPLAANVDNDLVFYKNNDKTISTEKIDLLFIGDTFVSKLGQFIRSEKYLKHFFAKYKNLSRRLASKYESMLDELGSPEKEFLSIESLFSQEEAALKHRYLSLTTSEARQRFDLIVLLCANSIYRTRILKEAIRYNHLLVGPYTWKCMLKNSNIKLLPSTYDKKTVAFLRRNSSINLNITSIHMNGAANQRIFEVPSGGDFLLTDYSSQLEDLFEMDKEIVCYVNKNDFHAKVEKYLHDKIAREKVIMAAKHRIAADHSYVHRAATILNTLKTTLC